MNIPETKNVYVREVTGHTDSRGGYHIVIRGVDEEGGLVENVIEPTRWQAAHMMVQILRGLFVLELRRLLFRSPKSNE